MDIRCKQQNYAYEVETKKICPVTGTTIIIIINISTKMMALPLPSLDSCHNEYKMKYEPSVAW